MKRNEIFEVMQETVKTDPEKIVQLAWDGFVPGCKNGYAAYDPKTGDWSSVSLGTTESIPNDARIYLYEIESNIFGNSQYNLYGDILSEEEHDEYQEKLDKEEVTNVDEYLQKYRDSSFNERFFEYLVYLLENEKEIDWVDIEARLKDQGY